MTRRTYRLLLLAYLACVPLSLAAGMGYLGVTYSETLAMAYDRESIRFGNLSPAQALAEIALVAGLSLLVLIGLYRFRHWARVLGLWSTALALAWSVLRGPFLYSGVESALIDLQTMLWGGALALAWFGPISAEFVRGRRGGAASTVEPAAHG